MRQRLFAGALGTTWVLLLPMIVWGLMDARARGLELPGAENAKRQAETVETSAKEEEPVTEPEGEGETERRIAEIIIHQAVDPAPEETADGYDAALTLPVSIGGEEQTLTLREYLCGVLMGEMPAEFPLEALKAQAVAARTYTLRRLEGGGVLSDDPSVCQAYFSPDRAEERYDDQAAAYCAKVLQAVTETDGQVMTYGGDLIAATYFSCSGGRTESAQAVWGSSVPYLVSVDSPGEEEARSFESTQTVPMETFLSALGITSPDVREITYTEGGGVDTITVGGKTFTGVELRSLFDLRSTSFTMDVETDRVVFHVRGYGHRVGLSQYGAKAMAEAGSDYREILTWYYSGAELTEAL